MLGILIGTISLLAWLYLLFGRGFFWLEGAAKSADKAVRQPAVAVVVPARNEAEVIGRTIASLVNQDYEGKYHILLVDDHSTDGTIPEARIAAEGAGRSERLTVIEALPLAPGWSGKLWALDLGIREVIRLIPQAEYMLLTDADILHPPTHLTRLVDRAEGGHAAECPYDLVSLMVRLNCQSVAEKLMIPAFVFFFQMLYPFRWAGNPRSSVAAAAGGVMLVRRDALDRIGGLSSIRSALIDDCTLAAAIKRTGRIWIGLSPDTVSLRAYNGLGDLWRMVARSAFTQLRYSALLLTGTILGMLVAFVAPPLLLITGWGWGFVLGLTSWAMMSLAYWPTVRFYGLSPIWAALLPMKALLYAGATLDSARRFWRGSGGEWKGRTQARR